MSYLHVFTYSERPNTPAAEMSGQVPVHVRRERNEMLGILSEKKRRDFYQRHLGQWRPVLFEQHKDKRLMSGYTDNYIRIEAPYDPGYLNGIAEVRLEAIQPEGVMSIQFSEQQNLVL